MAGLLAAPKPAPAAPEEQVAPLDAAPFGLNTHLASRYPDLLTMNTPADAVAQSGAGWAREDIHWYRVEPWLGNYDWSFTDAAMRALIQRGINVVGVLGHPPGWATPYSGDDANGFSFYPPDPDRFAAYASAVVSRYGRYVHHWEVWNEPDNPLFWKPAPDPQAYATLLIRASAAIHRAAPDAKVLIGGVNPFSTAFLKQVADAGAWGSFDILAIHPLPNSRSPIRRSRILPASCAAPTPRASTSSRSRPGCWRSRSGFRRSRPMICASSKPACRSTTRSMAGAVMPPASATTGRPRRLPHERRLFPPTPVSLGEATRVFARIGLLSFGGPAGQIALMHRVLVDEKRWLDEARFLHALNYCMLLPGPEAMQLATYAGWLLHGVRGGLIAGLLFVLPGAVVITALSAIYLLFGDVPLVQGLLFGLKAAVLAVVLEALIKVSKRALKGWTMVALAVAAFVAIAFLKLPFPVIIIGAALCGVVLHFAKRRRHGERRRSRDARARAGMDAAERPPPGHHRRGLVGDLAAAARRAASRARRRTCIFGRGAVLLEDGGRHLRRRLCRAVLCRAAGGRDPSLAAARRDADRARPCRNDARSADPGAGLRRLPRRRAAFRARSARRAASPARW